MRENAGDQITIGFRLASDWFRASRWFSEPIVDGVKQSQGNPDYIRHSIENCPKVSIVRSSAHLILETI